jgi:alpha-ketoglutarate-dependent taurine dioxygenase
VIATRPATGSIGVEVVDFDATDVTAEQAGELTGLVYREKIVVLKGQRIDAAGLIALGRALGEPEVYYQPMYHHPEHKEIFVSSNVGGAERIGVPKTGQCWHADYQFMARPFGLTLVYPQVVPDRDRGTYFIDMAQAYRRLPAALRDTVDGTHAWHSPRRHFKIRPSDVYRPVHELLDEIERETPAVAHPTVFAHPATGEPVLYVSEGLTFALRGADGAELDPGVLRDVLDHSGQLDTTFTHEAIHLQTLHQDDLLIWDNRALVHRARHTGTDEPAVSFRVTVHDGLPFHPELAR